ncbi:transcriptional regulator [Arthrobacter sp. H5]|uniref:transcriptional regulator n=1 Tax=Arthrobacter sp. H5 TaxID=1267973 RepID=UPI000485C572|nr:transcriptional regulator [Arthrobacter sp. H5]
MEQRRPLEFWIKLVDGLIDEQFEASLEEHGVTRRQWQILNLLAKEPATMTDLNTALAELPDDHSEETLPEQLEELTDSNWLTAQGTEYALTELGRSSVTMLTEVVSHNRDRLGADVSPADYQTATDVLEHMAKNLGWVENT